MSNWISVKDRLPDHGNPVYIWPPIEHYDYCYVACYLQHCNNRWEVEFYNGVYYESAYPECITHWMEIEPPKEKESE